MVKSVADELVLFPRCSQPADPNQPRLPLCEIGLTGGAACCAGALWRRQEPLEG